MERPETGTVAAGDLEHDAGGEPACQLGRVCPQCGGLDHHRSDCSG